MTRHIGHARLAAGISAAALGFAGLTFAAGEAAADSFTAVKMTVSDATPQVNDTIALSAKVTRSVAFEDLHDVKFVVPACLRYVNDSAAWEGSQIAKVQVHESTGPTDAAFVKVSSPKNVGGWRVPANGSRTISMKFTVTPECGSSFNSV